MGNPAQLADCKTLGIPSYLGARCAVRARAGSCSHAWAALCARVDVLSGGLGSDGSMTKTHNNP